MEGRYCFKITRDELPRHIRTCVYTALHEAMTEESLTPDGFMFALLRPCNPFEADITRTNQAGGWASVSGQPYIFVVLSRSMERTLHILFHELRHMIYHRDLSRPEGAHPDAVWQALEEDADQYAEKWTKRFKKKHPLIFARGEEWLKTWWNESNPNEHNDKQPWDLNDVPPWQREQAIELLQQKTEILKKLTNLKRQHDDGTRVRNL